MDNFVSQVSTSPIGALVVVAAAVAGGYWYLSQKPSSSHSREDSSVVVISQREGKLLLSPNPSLLEEYRRDYNRFKNCGSIEGLDNITEVSQDDLSLMYCLSASIGMDVLLALDMVPPIINQPLFIVGANNDLSFHGFIGPAIGDRPDEKYSNQVLSVLFRGIDDDGKVKVDYDISIYSNCGKKIRKIIR